MSRKILLALILLTAWQSACKSQGLALNSYSNKMLFNVFAEPDAEIRDFLNLYIPSLLTQSSANPAGGKQSREAHVFIFTKHPFFKTNFANGRLTFECRRFGEKDVRVEEVSLCLSFNTQQDAETAYGEMVQALKPISVKNRLRTENGGFTGEFEDTASAGFNRVKIMLTTDPADKSRYLLFFVPGRM